MTDLLLIFDAAYAARDNDGTPATEQDCRRAGIEAVVRALRGEMLEDYEHDRGEAWERTELGRWWNEILGDAGAAAGGPTSDDGLDDTAAAEPAADLCEGCPPVGWATDKTRCTPCPRRRPAADAVGFFDFEGHVAHQAMWSEATFGPGRRTAGVCDHIRKELAEVERDPEDSAEWIDVVILALDGAWRAGLSPRQIIDGIVAKQRKNEGRTWPDWRTADPNKAIEHDRSKDTPAADLPRASIGPSLLRPAQVFAPAPVTAKADAVCVWEIGNWEWGGGCGAVYDSKPEAGVYCPGCKKPIQFKEPPL